MVRFIFKRFDTGCSSPYNLKSSDPPRWKDADYFPDFFEVLLCLGLRRKRLCDGAEIAGIKMEASLHVSFVRNLEMEQELAYFVRYD